jgi:allantoicase
MFFSAMNNLLAPGRGINMGDGWETKRRRGPGYDWVIVQLGRPGRIQRLVVDTLHFKGNYPDRCCIDAAFIESGDASADNVRWIELLPEQKLQAHREHSYQTEILDRGSVFTHVRLNIFPDGGVSRLHVLAYPEGKPA